jgi:hypothetical protein
MMEWERLRDWTRYEIVFNARVSGASLREAGELIGVSRERARQMQDAMLRREARRMGMSIPSPLAAKGGMKLYRELVRK